jgi:cell wall-associated protease
MTYIKFFKKYSMLSFNLWAFLFLGTTSWATPIAVVDSGVDIDHPSIVNKIWVNPNEIPTNGIDDDNNLYIDDIHGWNFVDKNNQILDYSLIGAFHREVHSFFEVQKKMIDGTATDEEVQWFTSKKADAAFVSELGSFGLFAHGTHVSGIASRNAPSAKIMGAKILSTNLSISKVVDEINLNSSPFETIFSSMGIDWFSKKNKKLEEALMKLVDKQSDLLKEVAYYLKATEMRVANCSWASTYPNIRGIVYSFGYRIFGRTLTEYEVNKFIEFFFRNMLERGSSLVKIPRETLFVMAAGNDGINNDSYPIYPANLRTDNTITVAATRGYDRLASFSNFGVENVDIAAPGVGIMSTVPGGGNLAMSGTSMASPFVAEIVGRIIDANSKLDMSQVKKVLFETVDKKDYLSTVVVSGGIANGDRAVKAAELSRDQDLDGAIEKARKEIADVQEEAPKFESGFDGDPVPLVAPIQAVP